MGTAYVKPNVDMKHPFNSEVSLSTTRDMQLFDFPPELMHLVFDHIVTSRVIQRVMRIRTVDRQFKTYIDDSIFRLGLLSHLVGCPEYVEKYLAPRRLNFMKQSSLYFKSYITYQVLREQSSTSLFGRIRRAAEALCENDGDTGNEAIMACIKSLIPLALAGNTVDKLLSEPKTDDPDDSSDEDLEADTYVAAVYLGKQSYVESLTADGTKFCKVMGRSDVCSTIFGDDFHAATMGGNLDMIKFLLSCTAEYRDTGVLTASQQRSILWDAAQYGHEAAFNFALDKRPISLPFKPTGCKDSLMLGRVYRRALIPEHFERLDAILVPDCKSWSGLHKPVAYPDCASQSLRRGVNVGNVRTVRYFLDKGVDPNFTSSVNYSNPLVSAIDRDNETIIRMLLEAGADPNLPVPPYSALVHAVWKGSRSSVKLLLSHSMDINQGRPPPIVIAVLKENMEMFRLLRDNGATLDTPETGAWAMKVAKLHGLSSMVDVLVREGVDQDLMLQGPHEILWPLEVYSCNRTYGYGIQPDEGLSLSN
ncbi:ankyrin [Xylaria scruposa]|nr:ankyrin [Xylaria scruposa]